VEYIWYECPSFDNGRIMFSRPELTNDDDVRMMFSIFCQHKMFPTIEIDASLLRSSFIILLDFSLILVSLLKMLALKCVIVSVKVCKSLSKLTIIKITKHVFCSINYISFHIKFLHIG
jgi:hypothetical protein